MTKTVRAIIFWLFVACFVVLAPLLVLYTFGFRYDIKNGRIEHTGIISLSTLPKDATVTVNGEAERSTTPVLIKQLRPREHEILLTKNGFLPWKKTIRAIESETVFIESIVLWADQPPVLENARGDVHLMNPTRTALASLESSGVWIEVWVETFQNKQRTLIARFPGSQTKDVGISWSPDGEWILLNHGRSEFLVSKRDGSEQINVDERLSEAFGSLWWNEGQPHDLLLTTATRTLSMTIPLGEISTLLSHPTETLLSQPERLFYTKSVSNRTHVISSSGGKESVIAILPMGSYTFIESRLPYLLLFEANRKRIILLHADEHDQPILLQTEATEAFWSPTESRLLYTNGFETHIFSPKTLQDTLIDRVSQPITSVAWHPGGTSIVLAHPNGVVAYDLHEPETFVQTKINNAQEISRVFIDEKGTFLFFLGVVDGTYGFYRQAIR